MTVDVEKLDAEIVAMAEAVVDLWRDGHMACHPGSPQAELEKAVAAKRAAMRPKPLSKDEALTIYNRVERQVPDGTLPHPAGIAAVLTACLERAYKVIEALPAQAMRREEVAEQPLGPWRHLSDIKSALDGRSA